MISVDMTYGSSVQRGSMRPPTSPVMGKREWGGAERKGAGGRRQGAGA